MRPFTTIAIVVLAIICVAHLLRVIFGWTIIVNGNDIPLWPSILAALFLALLTVMVWRENK